MKALTICMLASCALWGTTVPSLAQQTGKLFFEGDLVRGPQQGQAGPFCVLASQFKRKEQVAWRVRVLDADGKPVDDRGLKSLVVELADGKKFDLKYKGHPPRPPQTDYFWSGSWVIPDDQPTGSLSYKVIATDLQGQTQTWEPFKIAASQLTVVAGDPPFQK